MQLLTGKPQQGTITCDTCETPLFGKDAILFHCDTCANSLLSEVPLEFLFCGKHPQCGCWTPNECTERKASQD